MPTQIPEDMPTFSLGNAACVAILPSGHPSAMIGALLIEAKIVASSVQSGSLIDQGQVELIRGENSEAALGHLFSYRGRKVINHHNYRDAVLPGDVIRAGSHFVRLVE